MLLSNKLYINLIQFIIQCNINTIIKQFENKIT